MSARNPNQEQSEPYLPALHNDNGLTLAEDAEVDGVGETPLDATINVLLPVDLAKVGLGLGEEEWVDATIKMGISGRRGIPSDHDDGAHGTILGDEAGRVSRGRQDEDSRSVEIQGSPNSGHRTRLHGRHGALDHAAQLLEVVDVWDGVLGLEARLAHLPDGLVGVAALGRLAGKLVKG